MLNRRIRASLRRGMLGAIAVLPVIAAGSSQAADEGLPDRAGLVAALRAERFADLDAALMRLEDAVEAGQLPERNLDYAFRSFANSDPRLGDRLDAWVAASPQSFAARYARGRYVWHLADLARKSTTVSEAPANWRSMIDGLLVRGADDIAAALELEPQLSWAYGDLAGIANARGHHAAAERFHQAGLIEFPNSGVIHGIPFGAMDVSTEAGMRDLFALVDELLQKHGDDTNFLWLRGYKDWMIARQVCDAGDHQKGIELATRAVRATNLPVYLFRRAEIFRCARRPREAIADYDTVLERTPNYAPAFYGRAKAKRSLNQIEAALQDYSRAVALDPLNPQFLESRGWVFLLLKRADEAQADFEQALVYGKYDDEVLDGLAYVYQNKRNDPARAADIYRQLATLEPGRSRWLHQYGFSLMMAHDCRAIEVLDRYMAACEAGAYCGPERDDWEPHPPSALTLMLKGLRNSAGCVNQPSGT